MLGYEQKPSNLPCDGYQEPGWTPGSWLAHPGTGNWVTSLYQVTELPGDAFMGVSRNPQTYRVLGTRGIGYWVAHPGNWMERPGTGYWVTDFYQVTELPGDAFRGA